MNYVFTVFLACQFSWAGQCLSFFDHHRTELTPEQIESLKEASKGDYYISVQTKKIANRDRIVVLMGETHIKSREDSLRGQNVLNHFTYRGYEGLDFSHYWFSERLSEAAYHHPTDDMPEMSTIVDAMIEPMFDDLEPIVINLVAGQIIRGELTLEEALDRANTSKARAPVDDADPLTRRVSEIVIKRIESGKLRELLVAEINNLQVNGLPLNERAPRDYRNFNLELGYRPSFREKLAGLGYIYGIGARSFIALNRRNAYMIKSLHQIFETNPDVDKILVIVGQTHVPGMIEILSGLGFTEFEIGE